MHRHVCLSLDPPILSQPRCRAAAGIYEGNNFKKKKTILRLRQAKAFQSKVALMRHALPGHIVFILTEETMKRRRLTRLNPRIPEAGLRAAEPVGRRCKPRKLLLVRDSLSSSAFHRLLDGLTAPPAPLRHSGMEELLSTAEARSWR